jgi:hypothetical protein
MHIVTAIEPRWLTEVAPQFFKVADAARISKRKRDEKIQPLFDRFATDQGKLAYDPLHIDTIADIYPTHRRMASQQAQAWYANFADFRLVSLVYAFEANGKFLWQSACVGSCCNTSGVDN